MPAVTSGKILVTGANGYIGTWIIDRLLRQGYSVRAAVRSEDKGVHIKQTFSSYGDKLEVVAVGEITEVCACHLDRSRASLSIRILGGSIR